MLPTATSGTFDTLPSLMPPPSLLKVFLLACLIGPSRADPPAFQQFISGDFSEPALASLTAALPSQIAAPPPNPVPPTIWSSNDGITWTEQDALLRTRQFTRSTATPEEGTPPGTIVRLVSPAGPSDLEILLPLPGTPEPIRQRRTSDTSPPSPWEPAASGPSSWLAPAPPPIPAAPSTDSDWRDASGLQSFRATLVSANPREAVFQRPNSSNRFTIPLNRLGLRESIMVRRWLESHDFTPPLPPRSVGVSLAEAAGNQRVAREKDDRGAYRDMHAYSTPHYDFWSSRDLAGANLQAVGMSFEATWKLMSVLDWSHPWPVPVSGRHRVRIFDSMNAYHAAGGPKGSAGVFMMSHREFLVPFSSLALGGKIESTLHHEGTHQCMQEFLTFLPLWVAEGTAEYVGSLDFRRGHFQLPMGPERLRRTIDLRTEAGPNLPIHPLSHATLDSILGTPWWPVGGSANAPNDGLRTVFRYRSSLLVTAYFLEIERDRSKFLRFLSATRRLRDEAEFHRNRFVRLNGHLSSVYIALSGHWNRLPPLLKKQGSSASPHGGPPPAPIYAAIPDLPKGGDLALVDDGGFSPLLSWIPPGQKPRDTPDDATARLLRTSLRDATIHPRNGSALATLILRWQRDFLGIDSSFENRFYDAYLRAGLDLRPGRLP